VTGLTIEALEKALKEMEEQGTVPGFRPRCLVLPLVWVLSNALLADGVSPLCVWRGLR
jgi:hypothetical protein